MPTPTFTTTKPVVTHTTTVTRTQHDYFDWATVIAPVILGIFLFAAGLYGNILLDKIKERQRLSDVKKYFLALANNLSKVVEGQLYIIKRDVPNIESMANFDITIMIAPELNTKRIKSIADLDLYKIFVSNKGATQKNIDRLNALSSAIDFVDTIKDKLEWLNQELAKEATLYNERYNSALKAISKEKAMITSGDDYITVIKDQEALKLSMLYRKISSEFFTRIKAENISTGNSTKRYEYFIKPLFENTRKIKENTATLPILIQIGNLYYDYRNFIIIKNSIIVKFKDSASHYDLISRNIKKICGDLET